MDPVANIKKLLKIQSIFEASQEIFKPFLSQELSIYSSDHKKPLKVKNLLLHQLSGELNVLTNPMTYGEGYAISFYIGDNEVLYCESTAVNPNSISREDFLNLKQLIYSEALEKIENCYVMLLDLCEAKMLINRTRVSAEQIELNKTVKQLNKIKAKKLSFRFGD
jgi:hypothetical protein